MKPERFFSDEISENLETSNKTASRMWRIANFLYFLALAIIFVFVVMIILIFKLEINELTPILWPYLMIFGLIICLLFIISMSVVAYLLNDRVVAVLILIFIPIAAVIYRGLKIRKFKREGKL